MTDAEAIMLMLTGKKMYHENFKPGTYFFMERSRLIDNNGIQIEWDGFWSDKSHEKGWSIFEEPARGWVIRDEESNDIMVPCKCALCGGTGKMPDTYVSNYMRIGLSGINRCECLDCNGTGIVWKKENKRL